MFRQSGVCDASASWWNQLRQGPRQGQEAASALSECIHCKQEVTRAAAAGQPVFQSCPMAKAAGSGHQINW